MKKTEKNIYSLLENKPLEFEITLENANFIQKLRKKTIKKYVVRPLVLIDYIKIANLLNDCKELLIPKSDDQLLINSLNSLIKYQNKIVKIISIFINENEKFILKNLNIHELQKLLIKIIEFNNFTQFFFILTSLKSQITIKNPKEK